MTTKPSPLSSQLIIRNMIRADLPASVKIMRSEVFPSLSRRGFERMVKGSKIVCQVGSIDDVIVGVIVYLLAQTFIRILILCVIEDWKRKGVGRRMLDVAEKRAEGVLTRTKVVACVPENLLPQGTRYLRHMGYSATGVEPGVCAGEVDLVIMEKPIKRSATAGHPSQTSIKGAGS